MGAGASKAHEANTINPSSTYLPPTSIDTSSIETETAASIGTGSIDTVVDVAVAGQKWETSSIDTAPDDVPAIDDTVIDDVAVIDEVTQVEGPLEEGPPADVAVPAAVLGLDEGWSGEDVLAPLPDALLITDEVAASVLVSGADFENANISLVAFDSSAGQVEVLYGWVHPDAEAKILDAIIDENGLVEVTEPAMVMGQLDADIENNIHGELVTAVKSVKHHSAAGSPIPEHTHKRLADLAGLRETLPISDDGAVAAMWAHYGPALDASIATAAGSGDVAAIGMVTKFETEHEGTITKLVPVKDLGPGAPDLVATVKPASRPSVVSASSGRLLLGDRLPQGGNEYEIDLGAGFVARYRPHNDKAVGSSAGMQGLLEIQAPPGAGRQGELVGRLAQLNLNNKPLTAGEAEYTYLLRNAWAQGVEHTPAVRDAIDAGHDLASSYAEMLASERAHETVCMDQSEMIGWAKRIRIEADTAATPMRTAIVRDALAKQLGYASGADMAATPGYNPMPTREGPTHVWSRFDVNSSTLDPKWGTRKLVHQVTGKNLAPMLTSGGGVLTATEHRQFMGHTGVGMSEAADAGTGGSRAVFLRVKPTDTYNSGQWLEWNQPGALLTRSDWYGYNGDKFGNFQSSAQTRNPNQLVNHTAHNNEVMFRDGIDLFGPHGPDRIHLGSKQAATAVIAELKASGRTHIRNQPLSEVIVE